MYVNHDAIAFTPSALLRLSETPAPPKRHSSISDPARVHAVVALAHVAQSASTL